MDSVLIGSSVSLSVHRIEKAESTTSANSNSNAFKTLFSRARHGRTEEVKAHLDAGLDPDIRDTAGNTLFIAASQNGHQILMELLLEHGADMNAQNVNLFHISLSSSLSFFPSLSLDISTSHGYSLVFAGLTFFLFSTLHPFIL